jgi:peptidoglycan hydrolase-like protein with peptidoglycan-binding domain
MKRTMLALSALGILSAGTVVVPSTTAYAATSSSSTVTIKYPGYVLHTGSRGTYVKDLQQRLNKLGYSCGTADGVFDSKTLKAVKAFQKAHHLTVDGEVGPKTWNALFATSSTKKTSTKSSTKTTSNSSSKKSSSSSVSTKYPGHLVEMGSRGTYVKEVQQQLNKLGYSCGTADGVFGSKTLKAVKAFQKAHHLTADGVVGPATWKALFSSSTGSKPSSSTHSTSSGTGKSQAVAPTLKLSGLTDGEAVTSASQTVTVQSNEKSVSLYLNGKRQSGKDGKYSLKLSVGQNTITAEASNGAQTVKKSIHVGLSGEDVWATNYINSVAVTYSGIKSSVFKNAALQLSMDPSSADSIKNQLMSIPAWKETIDGINQEWQVNYVFTWTKNYKQFPDTEIGINNLFPTLPPIQNGSIEYEGYGVYYNAKTNLYTLSELQVGIEPPGVGVAPILGF